jgi:hypothetical protein
MLPIHVALVDDTGQVTPEDLAHVAAALQTQATRDVGPLWSLAATLDAFPSLRAVPIGYWPVQIVEEVEEGLGVHLDRAGQAGLESRSGR